MSNKKEKISPADIWAEYAAGVNFNSSLNLYDKVRKNENFYLGRQWEGLKAPDIEQPVLNFLKRIVTYFIAMIVSDDIAVSINSFKRSIDTDISDNVLSKEIDRVIEKTKAKALNREIIRDAAVDGDGALFFRFDPDIETGQLAKGDIVIEQVSNTNIIFGNPYDRDVQRQPYILITQRLQCKTVRLEAKKAGVKDWENIMPDNALDYSVYNENLQSDLTTVIVKLWRDTDSGTIHYSRSTQSVLLKDDTDLGYKRYPVAVFSWEKVKNCYHGQAAITDGVIQNQIFVNTMWALFMIQTKRGTFPTTFYDKSKIGKWDNRVGAAIGVQGAPDGNVVMNYRPADFSAQAIEIVQRTIDYTKEFMGASDAALGNVKPDNTSAIIAVQQASAAPLELQRLAFYQFVEDYIRIIIDIICTDYGTRATCYTPPGIAQENIETVLDFSSITPETLDLNIEVGSSSYWSELTQIQTADNLFANGIITDAEVYLNSIPDKYIKNKDEIIESLRAFKQQQQLQAQLQTQPNMLGNGGQLPINGM